MNHITQQTAANAEESASAAEELAAQSQEIRGVVGELVALIGGGASPAGKEARLSVPAQPAGFKNHRAATHPAQGPGKKRAVPGALAPEQIIPLEEDNFKDF